MHTPVMEEAEQGPRLPRWRFVPILAMLHVLYDCGERKVSDYFAVGYMFANDLMRGIYWDMALVYAEERGDDVVYSALLHNDLQHLVEVGVLKKTKAIEDCGKLGLRELDGYKITAEGLERGKKMLEQLEYLSKSMQEL